MPASSRETLYLIDAHSLIFQVFHAIAAMTSPSGLPTNAVFGFTRDLLYLRNQKKPTYLIAAFDVAGPTFRDKIYGAYKANRAPMPDDLTLQIPLIYDVLTAMRIPTLGIAGFEADDVIATLARAAEQQDIEVYIASSDKDLRQLLSDRIHIFSMRKQEVFNRDSLLKDWGITPEQVIDYQTLVGDSVDNVPGVPGIGPKTASQLLQQYQTLDNLVAHVDEVPGKKKENLKSAIPELELSRRLVRLRTDVDVPLTWDEWRVRPWDRDKLLELFRGFGFRKFADDVRQTPLEKPVPKPRSAQRDLFGDLTDDDDGEVRAAWEHVYHVVDSAEALADFTAQLRQQRRVALYVETTTLDPHATEIVGLAFAWQAGEAWYLPMRGPTGARTLDAAAALESLRPVLEDSAVAKVGQNIKFAWQVLQSRGITLGGVAGDSMVADYLLHAGERSHGLDVLAEKHLQHRLIAPAALLGKSKSQAGIAEAAVAKVAEYAGERADAAWRLCELLEKALAELGFKRGGDGVACGSPLNGTALYDDLEAALIEVLAEMEFIGVRLDVALLARMSAEMATDLARLEREIYELAGRAFNIGSVKQLREILFDELGYKSKSKTSIKGEASTDADTLDALAKEGHALPVKLLEHRKIAKLKSTYVDALPALVKPATGRVHASFNQTVAATGRLSASDPNLQNIPIRSELGGQIRQAFIPEEGWSLITADYSQVELRLLAHFSGDEALRRAFVEDRDIHSLVAAQVFKVELNDVTAEMRRMAKTINFGIIYGMSAFGLAQRLEIAKEEAATFIDAYFATYPRVLAYQDKLLADCRKSGYVSTILGRRREINGIRGTTSYKSRNQPEREAINMEIQGSAADLIKVAMLSLHRRFHAEKRRARLLLQIHDELVFEAPPEEAADVARIVRQEMTGALAERLQVPLGVDVGVGKNWLDVEPLV